MLSTPAGELIRCEMLDTAGSAAEFASPRDHYYAGADGFLLVLSLASVDSYEHLKTVSQEISRARSELHQVPIVVAANKCDLPEADRFITNEDLKTLEGVLKCPVVVTSAKGARCQPDRMVHSLLAPMLTLLRGQMGVV